MCVWLGLGFKLLRSDSRLSRNSGRGQVIGDGRLLPLLRHFGVAGPAVGSDQRRGPVWTAGAILGVIRIHLPLSFRRGNSQYPFL